jgi:multidrug efflux pump subunit AcrB
VNDFTDRGRVKRVYVQGDAPYRSRPEDLGAWYVRTAKGTMAPFSSFATLSWRRSPVALSRYNGWPAYEIQGAAASSLSRAALNASRESPPVFSSSIVKPLDWPRPRTGGGFSAKNSASRSCGPSFADAR